MNNFSWERWREDGNNAGQTKHIGYCALHLHSWTGQSMLEAPQPYAVQQTTRQMQDDEIMIDGESACAYGSTHSRDTYPTPTRPVKAETFEVSSKFGHCILA